MCCTRLAANAGRCKCRTQKSRQKSPSGHHRTNLLGYIFTTKARASTIGKNLLNSNIFSTCPHSMVNFGSLTAEIGWRVWGTQANFNGFHVLACYCSLEVNQTLHDVWPSPGLVHYTFWRILPPNEILPRSKFTLRPSLAFSNVCSVTA